MADGSNHGGSVVGSGQSILGTEESRAIESLLGRQEDLIASRPASQEELLSQPHEGVYSDKGHDFIDEAVFNDFGDIVGYSPQYLGKTPAGGADGTKSSSWSGTYVNDALAAASQAIQSFLTGQSLADARKLGAAEQFQSMAAWALPAGSLPGGFQEGGPMQQLAARKNRTTYNAPPRATRRVNPAALIEAGQVSPEVMGFIDQIIGAADQGRVVSTGGSSSG